MPISTSASPDALPFGRTYPRVTPACRRRLRGAGGLRDKNGLESAVSQPLMTFGGTDLYPTVAAKAAALAHSLIQNHPFLDGNKRVGHAAMEVFLILNGVEIEAAVADQEEVILAVASGRLSRSELADWIAQHSIRRN